MLKTVLILLVIGLSGCVHNTQTRSVASLPVNNELDEVFNQSLHRERLFFLLQLKVDQIEYSYYRGQFLLKSFDTLLDQYLATQNSQKSFDEVALTADVTPQLRALEVFAEDNKYQLNYFLVKSVEMLKDKNQTSIDKRQFIYSALKQFEEYLRYVPLSTRVALNSWSESFHEVGELSKDFKYSKRHLFVGEPKLLTEYQNDIKVQNHLDKMIQKIGVQEDRNVSSLVLNFRKYIKDEIDEQKRAPAQADSLKIANNKKLVVKINTISADRIGKIYETNDVNAAVFLGKSKMNINSINSPIETKEKIYINPSANQDIVKQLDGEIKKQIDDLVNRLPKTNNKKFVDVSFNSYSARTQKIMTEKGLTHVKSNLISLDWLDRNPKSNVNRIIKQSKTHKVGVVSLNGDLSTFQLLSDEMKQNSDLELLKIEEVYHD